MQKHKLIEIENIGDIRANCQTKRLLAQNKWKKIKKTSKNVEKSVFGFDISKSHMIK